MPMPTLVGVGAAASGTGAITPAYPAGYTAVADDIGVIWVECDGASTLTPPTGWALMVGQTVSTGTTLKLSALWRRIQGGDTAQQIPTTGNHLIGRMAVFSGCVTTGNPWNLAIGSSELTADTTISVPGDTTTAADCMVCVAVGTGQDTTSTAGVTGWTNASLASLTERMDGWTASGTGGGFAMATGEKATAGAIDATTATLSLTSNFKAHLLIALRGASAGPNTEPRSPLIRGARPSESVQTYGPYAAPNPSMIIGG